MWVAGVSYLEGNQSMAIKFVQLFLLVVVVLAFGVFAFDFEGGHGITDCGVKSGGCPVGRSLSADLAVVMIEYGCSSISCVCGFLLKSLNDNFLVLIV